MTARALARNPVVSAIAVFSLAAGIGANTAIFGILNALDLRTLPVPHPEQLVLLQTFPPDAQNRINIITGRPLPQPLSGAMFEELQTHHELFSDLFGFGWNDSNVRNLEANGVKYPGSVNEVTGDYFAAVGAQPLLGRLIGPGDFAMHQGASAPVAVLDFRGWQRLFGGDPAVVGKTVRVDGVPLTVVGVTTRNFVGLNIDHSSEVTAPLGYDGSTDFRRRDYLTLNVVGRLAPGIELGGAQAELATLWPRILEATVPDQFTGQRRDRFFAKRLDVQSIARGNSNLRDRLSAPLRILTWLVAVVLLVACVNTANLLLSRAATRRHEIAVRAALGAGRWQIIRPLLTEGLLISAIGALMALPVAVWSSRTLIRMVWTGYTPLTLDPVPDWRVILFTAGVAIAAAVLFSVAPAWLAMGVGPAGALGQNNQRTVRGGHDGLGRILISGQIALALLMTVAALLFVRTIHNLRFAHAGFDLNKILVIQLFPQTAHGKVPNRPVYYRRLAEELARLPGVEAVSYSNTAPVSSYDDVTTVTASEASVPAVRDFICPGFFSAMGMRVIAGRDFTWEDDTPTPRVAIISENLAQRLFPNTSPLGRSIEIGAAPPRQAVRVVGVVPEAALWKPRSGRALAVYTPLLQDPNAEDFQVDLRAAADPRSLIRPAQRVIESLGRHYALRTQTARELLDTVLFQERAIAVLATFFGVVALALASIGIYGVLSFSIARRTSEIGIRMALGARQSDVARLILRQLVVVLCIGIAGGILLAVTGSRIFTAQLFGVSAADPG